MKFSNGICFKQCYLSVGVLHFPLLLQLDFKLQDGDIVPLVYGSQGDWDSSLKIILDWSPFSSKEELLQQVRHIRSRHLVNLNQSTGLFHK